MKNRTTTALLWVTAILATAYLSKGQDFSATLLIILAILAAVNISLLKEAK
jgi:hypothetical protein